jgi:hypothetical protein
MDFSESTSVNWDSTTMVGRGEPIYTYNNTERSGSLSFSIVVDHPSVLNKLRKVYSDYTNNRELKTIDRNKNEIAKVLGLPVYKRHLNLCYIYLLLS